MNYKKQICDQFEAATLLFAMMDALEKGERAREKKARKNEARKKDVTFETAILSALKDLVDSESNWIRRNEDGQKYILVGVLKKAAWNRLGNRWMELTARYTGQIARDLGLPMGKRRPDGFPVYINKKQINELYEKYLGEGGLWA